MKDTSAMTWRIYKKNENEFFKHFFFFQIFLLRRAFWQGILEKGDEGAGVFDKRGRRN